MKTKLSYIMPLLGFSMALAGANQAHAALNGVVLPKTGKVVICHYPPGNIANVQDITVSVQAINAHLWDGVAGDQHEYDELQVNGRCPTADAQKALAATAVTDAQTAVTTATSTLTSKQATLTAAETTLTTAETNLTAETSKSNPQASKVTTLTNEVSTAQTAVNTAKQEVATAQTALTAAQTNLTLETQKSDAITAAVNTAASTISSTLANPNIHSTVTICHSLGNGSYQAITVDTNAWTDNNSGEAHEHHAHDVVANANNTCPDNSTPGTGTNPTDTTTDPTTNPNTSTQSTQDTPTVDTIDTKSYSSATTMATTDGQIFNKKSVRTEFATTRVSTTDDNNTPVIVGTVGNSALGSDTFAVSLNKADGSTMPTYQSSLTYSGTANKTWTLTVTTPLPAGVYNINAIRTKHSDGTHSPDLSTTEATIGVTICENGTNKYVLRSEWDGTKEGSNYYLGACSKYVASEKTLNSKAVGIITPRSTDEGTKSTDNVNNAIIKHAAIEDAEITGVTSVTGNFTGSASTLNHGVKTSQVGNMDISAADIDPTEEGRTNSGVTLTNVTLNNVYLDSTTGTITVKGGTAQISSSFGGAIKLKIENGAFVEDTSEADVTTGTIVDGTGVAGTDANNSAVRGRFSQAKYDVTAAVDTAEARRIKGTLTGATITNASTTTTTKNGVTKTVVNSGTISGGTFTGVTAFGKVTDSTVGTTSHGVTITNSVHSFASGTVGSRGSLNWKEKKQ